MTTLYYVKVITLNRCYLENSRSWRGVLDTALCDTICQWLAAGRWFSPGTTVSSTNKTDRHDIAEILLKVAKKKHVKLEIKYQLSTHMRKW